MEGTESLSARVEQNNITTTLGAKHLYDYTSHAKRKQLLSPNSIWIILSNQQTTKEIYPDMIIKTPPSMAKKLSSAGVCVCVCACLVGKRGWNWT